MKFIDQDGKEVTEEQIMKWMEDDYSVTFEAIPSEEDYGIVLQVVTRTKLV